MTLCYLFGSMTVSTLKYEILECMLLVLAEVQMLREKTRRLITNLSSTGVKSNNLVTPQRRVPLKLYIAIANCIRKNVVGF